MNKAIIIFGSSRSEGNTKKAIDALNSDNSMPVMDLSKMQISPYDYDSKNQNDDYLGLMEKILAYDTIILATPVYWYTMIAYMKIFIDRLSDCLGIRKDIGKGLAGKHVFVVASYGGSLPKHFDIPFQETCKYMKIQYGGSFLYYAGKNQGLLEQNEKISQFRKTIDAASSKQ